MSDATPRIVAYLRMLSELKAAYGWGLGVGLAFAFQNARHTSLGRLPLLPIALMTQTFNTLAGTICRLVFGPQLQAMELHPEPIFILGHFRSGTTYLHELMASDPRLLAPNGFQCASASTFLLTEPLLLPIAEALTPKHRPMDSMVLSLDRPQEDEFATLALTGRSPFKLFLVPEAADLDQDYLSLADLPAAAREDWLDSWIWFLKAVTLRADVSKASADNSPPGRLLLKSPTHTARIAAIRERFPNARFIHIARAPDEIFVSTRRLWREMSFSQSLSKPTASGPALDETIFSMFEEMYARYFMDRTTIPHGHLIEVRYEDLVADPQATLALIYEKLDLGSFAQVAPHFASRLGEGKSHRASSVTAHLSAGEGDRIFQRWAMYAAEFGYVQSRNQAGSSIA